jgi:hypothetical protein
MWICSASTLTSALLVTKVFFACRRSVSLRLHVDLAGAHLLDLFGQAKARTREHAQPVEHRLQRAAHEARDQRGHAHLGAAVVHVGDVQRAFCACMCSVGRIQRDASLARAIVRSPSVTMRDWLASACVMTAIR